MKSLNESIIHILSFYKQLNPLQIWYELSEVNNLKDRVSVAEIKKTLESLQKRGIVERISLEKDDWTLKLSGTQYSSS
jgi:Fe2+ or Zn2+ uptake regulation protein